ncbi:MAG: class I SAM-dependent methyltransferase [Pirellulaceae bacterium]
MAGHVCPWWGGYFIDNWVRRLFHDPDTILRPYVHPGMTVMDVGCGMGLFAIAMARLVGPTGKVIAVDLQQQMLDVLEKRALKAGVADRIATHCCEATSIGVREPVDFALSFFSAHEVPDLGRLLYEIHQCLRPQGKLLVVEPRGHVPAQRFESMLVLAGETGFGILARPHVRLSRAVVLAKGPAAGADASLLAE